MNYPQTSDKSDIWRGSLTPPDRLTRLLTFPHKVMSSMHLQSISPCISNLSFHSFYFCTPESSTLTQAGFLQSLKEFMLESTLGKLNSSTMERQPSNVCTRAGTAPSLCATSLSGTLAPWICSIDLHHTSYVTLLFDSPGHYLHYLYFYFFFTETFTSEIRCFLACYNVIPLSSNSDSLPWLIHIIQVEFIPHS